MIITPRASHATLSLALLLGMGTTGCRNDTTVDAQSARTTRATTPTDMPAVSDTLRGDTATSFDSTASTAVSAVSGTLEPQARALLRAELPGAVRTLSVKVGERVSAGHTIATLEVPAVRSAMAAAEAQVAAQEVALRQAQRERERTAQLLAVGGVSRTEMDDWDSRVQAADAAVQAARAQRATAAADVARLTVRAPFSGIVERRSATQGSIVQVGDELVSIIDSRILELEAGVAVSQAHRVRPGTRIALRVAGIGDSVITARVVRVAPALDPVTRQLRITVQVPNGAGRIPAGAWAEGTLLADRTGGR